MVGKSSALKAGVSKRTRPVSELTPDQLKNRREANSKAQRTLRAKIKKRIETLEGEVGKLKGTAHTNQNLLNQVLSHLEVGEQSHGAENHHCGEYLIGMIKNHALTQSTSVAPAATAPATTVAPLATAPVTVAPVMSMVGHTPLEAAYHHSTGVGMPMPVISSAAHVSHENYGYPQQPQQDAYALPQEVQPQRAYFPTDFGNFDLMSSPSASQGSPFHSPQFEPSLQGVNQMQPYFPSLDPNEMQQALHGMPITSEPHYGTMSSMPSQVYAPVSTGIDMMSTYQSSRMPTVDMTALGQSSLPTPDVQGQHGYAGMPSRFSQNMSPQSGFYEAGHVDQQSVRKSDTY